MKRRRREFSKLVLRLTLYSLLVICVSLAVTLLAAAIVQSTIYNLQDVRFVLFLLMILGASMITGLIFSYIISVKIATPVDQVRAAIKSIANGNFNVKLNRFPKSYRIINETVTDFGKMVSELNSIAVLRNDFVSSISHEFKTPLVSIKGYAELLKNANLDAEQAKYVDIIIAECRRLSILTEKTLFMSRLDSTAIMSDSEVYRIDEQIMQCVLAMDKQFADKKIDVRVDIQPIEIKADKTLMNDVWYNILSNAVKFTPDCGRITISSLRTGTEELISISDTGIGMDESTVKHIFDKYYQGDTNHVGDGLGLGLSITKRILDLNKAKVDVYSSIGNGTTFNIAFPSITKRPLN